jgi:hypothetical protein
VSVVDACAEDGGAGECCLPGIGIHPVGPEPTSEEAVPDGRQGIGIGGELVKRWRRTGRRSVEVLSEIIEEPAEMARTSLRQELVDEGRAAGKDARMVAPPQSMSLRPRSRAPRLPALGVQPGPILGATVSRNRCVGVRLAEARAKMSRVTDETLRSLCSG